MTQRRLSECMCINMDDKIVLRTALNRAIGVVDERLKEEKIEANSRSPGILVEFYEKDLEAYHQLHKRLDEIPDCPSTG